MELMADALAELPKARAFAAVAAELKPAVNASLPVA